MSTPTFAPHGDPQVFAARLGALPETAAFVRGFCERHAIRHDVGLRLTLILEELVTNTVTHGHGGDSDATICIALTAEPEAVAVFYEDAAPRFDPRPQLDAAPGCQDLPLDSRPVGGLGLSIVGRFVTSGRYAHEEGRNRLWLAVPLVHDAGPAGRS